MSQATFAVNNSAAVSKTFLLNSQSGRDAEYIESTSSLQTPTAAAIKHTVLNPGAIGSDRHLVQFSKSAVDSEGVRQTAIMNITISVPRTSALTETDVKDLWYYGKNFLSDTNFALVYDGITP